MNIENKVPLRLKIENVRAVKKADIVIEGLTVLCGVNGTGKSTIARLLEDAIEADLYFDDAYRSVLFNSFSNEVVSKLRLFVRMVSKKLMGDDTVWDKFKVIPELMSHDDACKLLDLFNMMLDDLNSRLASVLRQDDAAHHQEVKRVIKIVSSEINIKSLSAEALMVAFKQRADELRQKLIDIKASNLTYENFNAAGLYSPVLWEGNVSFSEMGRQVLAYRGSRMSATERFISVRDVVYIESPLVSTLQRNEKGDVLKVSGNFASLHSLGRPPKNLDEKLLEQEFAKIIHGTVEYKESSQMSRRWMYVRDDGEEFPLNNSATGIKAFALLNVLYSYGCLNKNTVLIIDEPEAHLHPRWIVEYAKILIYIISNLNVRVLVASHSPDMINALQSFAHARDLTKCTRFYQAVPFGRKYPYDFKYINRGMDVGRIFDTFNKVYPDIEESIANM